MKPDYKYRVDSPEKIPSGKHYAIIMFTKVTEYTGYEKEDRSGGTALYHEYYAFTKYSEWEQTLRAMAQYSPSFGAKPEFVGLIVEGKASIQVSINVEIGEPTKRGGPGDR